MSEWPWRLDLGPLTHIRSITVKYYSLWQKCLPWVPSLWIMLFMDDPNVGMNALFLVSMGSINP